MDGIRHQDPFLWDVDAVVEHLCVASCSWAHDPTTLADTIRSEEVDGKTLLTYEHLCSRQELTECLGVKLARHKAALGEAIINLRSTSRGYQNWKKELEQKQLGDLGSSQPSKLSDPPPFKDEAPAQHGLLLEPHAQADGLSGDPHSDPPKEAPVGQDEPKPTPNPNASGSVRSSPPAERQTDEGDRGTKRKRVAPMNLGSKPVNTSPTFVPTEADSFGYREGINVEVGDAMPWEYAPPHAYLGDGSISSHIISSSSEVLSTRILELGNGDFATSTPNSLPRGRRRVVSRATVRLLRQNSRKEAQRNQGYTPAPSTTQPEDDDSVLDLSDLPESLDEEILAEIAAEELQRKQQASLQTERLIPRERVQAILDDRMEAMTRTWRETKLLKHQRRAYKIWTNARRLGTRLRQVLEAQRQAKFYGARIKKLCAEILDQHWSKEADVKLQARCLEQSVDDKLHQQWLVSMLESRTEPKKPHAVPAPRRPPARRQASESDGEILTSSDEDDFIVADDKEGYIPEEHVKDADQGIQELPSRDHQLNPSRRYPDVTERASFETPVKSASKQRERVFIDLTTPTKPQTKPESVIAPSPSVDLLMPTAVENFESVEEIGDKPPKHWTRKTDRWRLAICLMSHLAHTRRTSILRLIQDKPEDEAWLLSIHMQMTDPLDEPAWLGAAEARLVAFDFTRIFLSFVKIAHCREDRIVKLGRKDRRLLESARRTWFPRFCKFLLMMAPRFPQDSQIYRAVVSDDEVEVDDAVDVESAADAKKSASQTRKPPAKEIVRNKEAVQIREREKQRVKEQEERRLKLRASLSTLDAMPRDKSRLIINESKQEDQAFIYVNNEIAKNIKDHQIDGVRFLWNQMVLDPEVRQGCLLAHTMGLGKTMQVITLLVALSEEGMSPDASFKSQIPQDLRESKTLVLCPSGLVDNWMDEFLTWAPRGVLGQLRRVDAVTVDSERPSTIRDWAREGGVLIIGYNMFKKVFDRDEEIENILTDSANIVIADEAHILKNPNAKVTRVCSNFRTTSRIALTGSPLANNVEEYHSMIDWVAPNFLGPLGEFRDIYANPIHTGLWTDSLAFEKRRALKMLQVLKETVAPKVNRATIKSIRDDLPPKQEFVIFVSPTAMQHKLYAMYVDGIKHDMEQSGENIQQSRVFRLVNDLGLICNHPRCFREKVSEVQEKLANREEVTFPRGIVARVLRETKSRDPLQPSLSLKVGLLTVILDESQRVGDKVLVFSQSISTLDYLSNLFAMQKRRFRRMDGSTAVGKRQDMVKSFNQGDHEVYLISTSAGGVGLNIQGANRVVIFDFKWNPVTDQQAIGRAYRIGQKKPVFVYRLVVAGSFEDDLQNKAVFKTQLSSRVVDKKNPVSWSKRLSSLLHHLKPAPQQNLSVFDGRDEILDKLIPYKADGGFIQSIVSSDTFEEEDPTVVLTAEERRDAENMVTRNRLRATNPEEYDRLQKQEAEEQRERRRNLEQQLPPLQPQYVGAAVAPTPMSSQASAAAGSSHYAPNLPSTAANGYPPAVAANGLGHLDAIASGNAAPPAAPMPMAGTGTFFGQQSREPERSPAIESVPAREAGTPPARRTLFGRPTALSAKQGFQNELAKRVQDLLNAGYTGLTEPSTVIAGNVTAAIDKVRKEKQLGSLPDDQQWRWLGQLLVHDRFVRHTVSGSFSPTSLALSSKKDLESRVAIHNALSEEEFGDQLARGLKSPDPKNLEKIRRLGTQSPRSPRAQADLKVMREAADNRRRSSKKLPSWANRALSEDHDRGPC